MEIAHALERGFGYLLLLFSLPMFMGLYIAFHSGFVSPFFLQGLSGMISSLTNNSLLSSLFSFSILNNLLFISGLVAIAGGALILFGSKEYTGLSAIGTEVLIISVLSLVLAYATSSYMLPYLISHVGASASSMTSIISTIASPLISEVFIVDVAFIIFGAALITLRFLLPYLTKVISAKMAASKKKHVTTPTYSLYRYIGIPAGSAVMVLVLALITIFGPSILSGTTYSTTPLAANSVSLAYQSLAETPQILNLSDYYFLSAPNLNNTYNGQLTLSPSFEPLPFSLPMQFSVSKLNDPFLRFNFDLNISEFSGLISSFHKSNSTSTIPNNIKFTFLYNESGIITCSNLVSNLPASSGSQCTYNSLPKNFSKMLMNVNSSNANDSIIGTLFNAFSLPAHLLSSSQNNSTPSQNYFPSFTFVNHVNYNGNNCSLFNINGNYSISTMHGQICILDTNGLPAFLSLDELLSAGNIGSFDVKFAFDLTSLTNNVTLAGINSLPQNATFTNSTSGLFG